MIFDYFVKHPFQCFIVMVISGAGLGIISIDLYRVIASNINFFADDIIFALKVGALQQMGILFLQMAFAMICYFIVRFCEHVLFYRLTANSVIKKKHSLR